jgi:hypothetical protein
MFQDQSAGVAVGISVAGSVPVSLPLEGKGKAIFLLRLLEQAGFELSKEMTCDYLVSIDHNENQYNSYIRNGGSANKAVLIRLEPISVFPAQYRTKVMSKYSLILSPGHPDNAENGLGWPYQYHLDPNSPIESNYSWLDLIDQKVFHFDEIFKSWESRKIEFSLIAGNKVSPYKEENYRIRRKIAHFMDPQLLQVYGPLWISPLKSKLRHRLATLFFALRQKTLPNLKSIYGDLFWSYPTAKGFINDKHEILRETKFAIVVENSNSYASEKLFDAMVDGCVPIYIGAKLADLGLSDSLAIQSTGDLSEIARIRSEITKEEVLQIMNSIDLFLKSGKFKQDWLEESVYNKIAAKIVGEFRSQ